MEGELLRQAIVRPAQVQGYEFEPGLEELILDDIREEASCLPLLEFALAELWNRRDTQRRWLTLAAYWDMGRLMGALDKYATEWYVGLVESKQVLVRRVMLQLVRIGLETKDTRWRRRKADLLELDGNMEEIIDQLVDQRLLVSREDEVDLVHERLMEGWELFSRWRTENRDLRRLAQRVKDAYQEWVNQDEDEDFLLGFGLLKQLQSKWSQVYPALVPAPICEFYERSIEAEYQRTSFQKLIDSFKERLLSIQSNLSERVESIENFISTRPDEQTEDGLSKEMIVSIQTEITDFIKRTQTFEVRMLIARKIADWIEINYDNLIKFLIREIEIYQYTNNEELKPNQNPSVKKDVRKLLNWLRESILGGEPLLERLPSTSANISKAAYGNAFISLKNIPELESLDNSEIQEFNLYLDYLRDALDCID